MARVYFTIVMLCCFELATAQIEKVYGDDGLLLEIFPLNEREYEGKGYRYYPGGAIKAEVPHKAGDIHVDLATVL